MIKYKSTKSFKYIPLFFRIRDFGKSKICKEIDQSYSDYRNIIRHGLYILEHFIAFIAIENTECYNL